MSCGAWTPISFLFPKSLLHLLIHCSLFSPYCVLSLCTWMQRNMLNNLLLYVLVPSVHLIVLLPSELSFSRDSPFSPLPCQSQAPLTSVLLKNPHSTELLYQSHKDSCTVSSKGRGRFSACALFIWLCSSIFNS